MTDEQPTIDVDDILAHTRWVHRLARSLLFDQAQVDDVVQQTWLIALRKQPQQRDQLRSWLGGIVRNVVRQQVRTESRRAKREKAAAVPPDAAVSTDVVAEAELHRRVVGAVMSLAEPYRTTVLLRYFKDLGAEQVAQQMGVPSSTVRTRQERALEQLRRRLDREFGGTRSAWSLGLLPLALASGASSGMALGHAAGSTLKGVVTMTLKAKIAAGAAALLVLLAGLWWAMDPASSPPVSGDGAHAPLVAKESPPAPRPLSNGTDAAPATPLALATPGRDPDGDALAHTGTRLLQVTGRLVDRNGSAVTGAEVWLHPSRVMRAHLGLAEHYELDDVPWSELSTTRSDGDGAFAISADEWIGEQGRRPPTPRALDERTSVAISHPDFRVHLAVVAGTDWRVDLGDIVLETGAGVRGRVVDEQGRPLAGVSIGHRRNNAWSEKDLLRGLVTTSTDRAGRFQSNTHWGGNARIEATHPGKQPWFRDVFLHVDDTVDLGDIVLRDAFAIRGLVTNANNKPLAGADVMIRPSRQRLGLTTAADTVLRDLRVTTSDSLGILQQRGMADDAGRFVFDRTSETTYTVYASKSGYEPSLRTAVTPGTEPEDEPVHIQLRRESLVALTLVDQETGEPIPGATATLIRCSEAEMGEPPDGLDPYLDVMSGRAAAQRLQRADAGVGLIVGGPAGSARTRVVAQSLEHETLVVDLPGVSPGEVLERTLQLKRGARLSGRVTDADGNDLPGVEVTCRLESDDEITHSAMSDDTGRFDLGPLGTGTWTGAATEREHSLAAPFEVVVVEGTPPAPVDLVMQEGGTIEGLVTDEAGRPSADRAVSIGAKEPVTDTRAQAFEARTRQPLAGFESWWDVRTDQDGRFRIDGLRPGEYSVRSFPAVASITQVVAGQASHVELVLRRPPSVRGRVLDASGTPVIGAGVTMEGRGMTSWSTETNSRGEYSLEELNAYPYPMTLAARLGDATTAPIRLQLDWGQDEIVELRFGDGSVSGQVVDANTDQPVGGAVLEARLVDPPQQYDRDAQAGRSVSASDGSFRMERLAPGTYELRVQHESLAPVVQRFELSPGQALEQRVVLQVGGSLVGRSRWLGTAEDANIALQIVLHSLDGTGRSTSADMAHEGAYRVGGVAEGRYRYSVRAKSPFAFHDWASGEVDIVDGRSTTLDIDLVPRGG